MGVFPTSLLEPLVTIHTFSFESIGGVAFASINANPLNSLGTGSWENANRAIFIPFAVFKPIIAVKMFIWKGGLVSGNVDVGIYDAAGTRIVSNGSTADTANNAIQIFDIADTELTAGQYYFALAFDNSTSSMFRQQTNLSTGGNKLLGLAKMETAFPLPATATFASVTTDYIPLIGLTTRTVV